MYGYDARFVVVRALHAFSHIFIVVVASVYTPTGSNIWAYHLSASVTWDCAMLCGYFRGEGAAILLQTVNDSDLTRPFFACLHCPVVTRQLFCVGNSHPVRSAVCGIVTLIVVLLGISVPH